MNAPHDVTLLDPPAQPDGTTAETNAALSKAIQRLQQPSSGGTDEARERALAYWIERDGYYGYWKRQDNAFRAGYDAARAESARKVAELERRLEQVDAGRVAYADRAEKAETRVRELKHSRFDCPSCGESMKTTPYAELEARVRELEALLTQAHAAAVRDRKFAEAALTTERERNEKAQRFISAVRSEVEEYKSEPYVDCNPREYMKRIHALLADYTKRALSATPPAVAPAVTQLYRDASERLPAPPNTPAPEVVPCDPPGACVTHGRCWTHSDWDDT